MNHSDQTIHLAFVRESLQTLDVYRPPLQPTPGLRLHLNENHWGPAPTCLAPLEPTAENLATYTDGSQRLENAIATLHAIPRANVMATLGAAGGLQQIFHTSVTQADVVLLPNPGWSQYQTYVKTQGAKVATYPVVDAGHTWTIDLEALRQAIMRNRPVCVVINDPHMPTGGHTPRPALLQLFKDFPLTLFIVDQAYAGFDQRAAAIPEDCLAVENLVLVRTFSKAYGLAAVRVGYLLANATYCGYLRKGCRCLGSLGIRRNWLSGR
jgi:histidinol-phosphate aminotransferase